MDEETKEEVGMGIAGPGNAMKEVGFVIDRKVLDVPDPQPAAPSSLGIFK